MNVDNKLPWPFPEVNGEATEEALKNAIVFGTGVVLNKLSIDPLTLHQPSATFDDLINHFGESSL